MIFNINFLNISALNSTVEVEEFTGENSSPSPGLLAVN
jgi:hypothetical protein